MKTIFLACIAVVVVACGSDAEPARASETSPTASTANACEAAGTKLCARACACATDGKCRVGVALDGVDGTATIDFDDEKGCRDLYVVFGCAGGGEPALDYGRCEAALSSTKCIAGGAGEAVLMPAECKVDAK